MKNKKTLALVGVFTGVCILSTAAFANYQAANGYDTLKKSLLSFYKYDNCTVNVSGTLSNDGAEILDRSILIEYDRANKQKYVLDTQKTASYFSEAYSQDGKDYYRTIFASDEPSEEYDGYYMYNSGDFQDCILGSTIKDYESRSTQKILRFAELLGDTVVGDLKNNIICTDDGDDSKTYEISLTSIQIPELINAGLGALFSVNDEYIDEASDNPDDIALNNMRDNQRVESAKLTYTVNKDNMLTSADSTIIFKGSDKDGNSHDITANLKLDVTNIGTTSVKRLDTSKEKIHDMDADMTDTDETEYND